MAYLVSYAYHEGNARSRENLRYFLQEGVEAYPDPEVRVSLVINGTCSVSLPPETDSFRVSHRANQGFDWAAHAHSLELNPEPFRGYLFLNASQRGPFMPSYWPPEQHWIQTFWSRVRADRKTGIVGASVFTHPVHKCPIVETWAFFLTAAALHVVVQDGNIFNAEATSKLEAVQREDRLTPLLQEHGFGVESLLLKYRRHADWSRPSNENLIPSRPWQYEGINEHPLETVFYKSHWQSADEPHENSYVCPFEARYTQWAFDEPEHTRPILRLAPHQQTPLPLVPHINPIAPAPPVDHTKLWQTTITLLGALCALVLLLVLVLVM